MAKPFLKWAGGKAKLAERVLRHATLAPDRIRRYHEPFLGGGAVFFALHEAGAVREAALADTNADLIATYTAIRDDVEGVIAALARHATAYLAHDHSQRSACYYDIRDKRRPRTPVTRAARLLFLNKTCYNGLYRVNRKGRFNVPHGRYDNPRILDAEALRAASRALACATLDVLDFTEACARAQPGDFVYLDPPYQPLSATSHFTSYTRDGFGIEDQQRLRTAFDDLTARGVPALLSNSSHPDIHALYERYEVEEVPMGRNINSKGNARQPIAELLISNRSQVRAAPPMRSAR